MLDAQKKSILILRKKREIRQDINEKLGILIFFFIKFCKIDLFEKKF